MKARISNDEAREPGYGVITLSGVGDTRDIENATFSIKRLSDHKNLGECAWQDAEVFGMPLGIERNGDGARIFVGPSVVDNLQAKENYRLFLAIPNQPVLAADFRPEGLHRSSPVPGASPLDPTLPDPEKQPEPFPVPPLADRAEQANMAYDRPIAPLAPPEAFGTRQSRRMAMVSGLVLLLLLAGGAMAWMQHRQPVIAAPEMVDESPLTLARRHLDGQADPENGMRMAAVLRNRDNGMDAAFLLVEDAAQKGNGRAALELAEFYDPTWPQLGTVNKDPLLAWEYYRKAESLGMREAVERIRNLRSWAERESAGGAAGASEILSVMP